MQSLSYLLFAAAAACLIVPSAAHPAAPLAIEVVRQQFINSKLVPDVVPTFDPIGLLTLNYSQTLQRTTVGQAVSRENVTLAPIIYIRGSAAAEATVGGPFNVTTIKYTVLGIDGNYAGSPNPTGFNLHFLQNDLTYGENDDHTVTLDTTTAPVIPYAAPAPPANSGPHRYTWLVYQQPANFSAPSTPQVNSGVHLFNLTQYVAAAQIGAPLAGTYFTVEEGSANITVASTTAVDSTTLPQYTASSTSASASASATKNAGVRSGVELGMMGGMVAFVGAVFAL